MSRKNDYTRPLWLGVEGDGLHWCTEQNSMLLQRLRPIEETTTPNSCPCTFQSYTPTATRTGTTMKPTTSISQLEWLTTIRLDRLLFQFNVLEFLNHFITLYYKCKNDCNTIPQRWFSCTTSMLFNPDTCLDTASCVCVFVPVSRIPFYLITRCTNSNWEMNPESHGPPQDPSGSGLAYCHATGFPSTLVSFGRHDSQ